MPQKAIQTFLSDKEELSEFCLQTVLFVQILTGKEIFFLTHKCIMYVTMKIFFFSSVIYTHGPTFFSF